MIKSFITLKKNANMIAGLGIMIIIFTFFQQYLPVQTKSILSGSMEPTFYTGSIIFEERTNSKTSFKPGDVITFKVENGILITHRIHEAVKKDGKTFYRTKGDHNNGYDLDLINPNQIVGKYTGITIPYVGYIQHFFYSKIGLLAFMVIPGILLLILSWKILFQHKASLKHG